ncbi:TIGR03960 family B12-binding radical SAM protein [Clostridium estertheticum]|uniref:TIGR03960 family B12-binding radical SAM protein n=1 Tax=Clostridium estertheticum TaxID=238834 RepID=A0A7Y3SUY8_9CLOT|nr:TIGR03960 family B12-binding radical SAM protein [Clostridium estertheticum]MBW9169827.1 TIGR03960 family B12-binding radical SAM protein [Clostridium estertheticum]MBX4258909.1 TIGR03960 family B12-binding radical SAM protein [Clostridium estertheticum]MBX4267440.1 TIGR03960 family B12-binding radical SAM protein [Clostridium estertheticum]MBX4269521.1 TIGR03960 family B12-binding radical SAM protein [Clostridium estertheticum]NNU75851.1 TIGR03960 family B12-binding radical SAM protein [Cl
MNKISDDILFKVEKPARYIGGELNCCYKDIDKIDIRFAFCFPDVYEVGMSHLGSRILYHVLNERVDTYCERAFAPWPDMEKQMRDNNISLYALESKDSLKEFDFLGFTLQYEMSYTNILNMLDMSGITIRASNRGDDEPIIMAGGPCAYNPEPLYDIVDFFELGDGEEIMNEVLDVYKNYKGKKKEFLREISKIRGVYVPSLYEVSYNEDNTIREFKPKYDDVPSSVKKRFVVDFDKVAYPEKIVVPYTEIVHDRVILETFRGCTNGCRFCQAGMIYRPVREKSTATLLDEADKLLKSTGYREISLSSLSICDYSDIKNLVTTLIEKNKEDHVSVSLPSIRINSFSVDLIKEIQKVKKTGITFAPEAGTQRMRDIINKGVTEEQVLEAVSSVFASGWSTIKLYFMVGLPYETLEDVRGIAELSDKVAGEYFKIPKETRKRGLRVTTSTAIFVPKPFTPFQWVPQSRMEDVVEKIKAVKYAIKSKAVTYNYHESIVSYLEAVMARGDRRICDVIIKAFEKGAKFDGWGEYFNFEIWKEAMEECGVSGDFYAYRARSYDEVLPWDFIDIGVNKEYLINENEKAKKVELTQNCKDGCTQCGVNVNFKEGTCFNGALFNQV